MKKSPLAGPRSSAEKTRVQLSVETRFPRKSVLATKYCFNFQFFICHRTCVFPSTYGRWGLVSTLVAYNAGRSFTISPLRDAPYNCALARDCRGCANGFFELIWEEQIWEDLWFVTRDKGEYKGVLGRSLLFLEAWRLLGSNRGEKTLETVLIV